MTDIHLFGVTTTTGKYLEKIFKGKSNKFRLYGYSRKDEEYNSINFKEKDLLLHANQNILISCAPIWKFKEYIQNIDKHNKEVFKKINTIIVCSSSSVVTKKFAFNKFDKELVKKLISSEDQLIDICKKQKVKCFILRPTMIYGCIDNYKDRNISLIVRIMRKMPFIFIPNKTGLRQPIHANQLAKAIFFLTSIYSLNENNNIKIFNIGGDEEITYKQMIIKLKEAFPKKDPINSCFVFEIPNIIFIFLIFPIRFFSPKKFEKFIRMSSNLSGFLKTSILINQNPEKFPIMPICK